MDSVLFSMFAISSPSLDEMLTKSVVGEKETDKGELQELISKNFMKPLRDSQHGLATPHVTIESITEIRALCRKLGWPRPRMNSRAADAAKGVFPLSLTYSLSFLRLHELDTSSQLLTNSNPPAIVPPEAGGMQVDIGEGQGDDAGSAEMCSENDDKVIVHTPMTLQKTYCAISLPPLPYLFDGRRLLPSHFLTMGLLEMGIE